MIFKCEAQGDSLYFVADSLEEAQAKMRPVFGDIPEVLLDWSEVNAIPEGETAL